MAKAKAKRTSSSKPSPKARRRASRVGRTRTAKKAASRKSARKPLKARRARPAAAKARAPMRKAARRSKPPVRRKVSRPSARKAVPPKKSKKSAPKARRAPARVAAKAPLKPVLKKPVLKTTVKVVTTTASAKVVATAPVKVAAKALPTTRAAAPAPSPARLRKAPVVHGRAPALQRERRRLPEADLVPTPPSSLDLDRSPSAARTGQAGIAGALAAHHETGPELTAGDVDASWESAYSTGDEAPGGDNPTPDQDVVDEIGKSLGLIYEDSEELQGANKITERDKHRWELDPASSEDFEDR